MVFTVVAENPVSSRCHRGKPTHWRRGGNRWFLKPPIESVQDITIDPKMKASVSNTLRSRAALLAGVGVALAACSPKSDHQPVNSRPEPINISGQWRIVPSCWAGTRFVILDITDKDGVLSGIWKTKEERPPEAGNEFYKKFLQEPLPAEEGTFGGVRVGKEIDFHWRHNPSSDRSSLDYNSYDFTGHVDGNKMSGKYNFKTHWSGPTLAKAARIGATMDPNELEGQWLGTKEGQ